MGSTEINSINMLAEKINEEGGIFWWKENKIYSYDNRLDNVETTNAARKAINDDGVCAIIGTMHPVIRLLLQVYVKS